MVNFSNLLLLRF